MRRIARWVGIAWMGTAFVSVLVVGFIELFFNAGRGIIIPLPGGFGEIYILLALGAPGYLLYAWGHRDKPRSKEIAMPAKKTVLTDAERAKRIREAARKIGASDDSNVLDKALKKIIISKRSKESSA